MHKESIIYVNDENLIAKLSNCFNGDKEKAKEIPQKFAQYFFDINNFRLVGFDELKRNHKYRFFLTPEGINLILEVDSISTLEIRKGIPCAGYDLIKEQDLGLMQYALKELIGIYILKE